MGRDEHAFDEAVRVALDHGAVHERARVAFVGVADNVFEGVALLAGNLPLQARREARAAASAQMRILDNLYHLLRRHFKRLLEALITSVGQVVFQRVRVDDAA